MKAAAASRQRRLQLQTSYGKAVIGPEVTALPRNYRRLRPRSRANRRRSERGRAFRRFITASGSAEFVRGELASMRDIAEIIKREVEGRPGSPEAASLLASRAPRTGLRRNFRRARAHLECALAIFDPERDSDLAFRSAPTRRSITAYLALPLAIRRDRSGAESRRGDWRARPKSATSAPPYTGHFHFAMFEMITRDRAGAAPHSGSSHRPRAHTRNANVDGLRQFPRAMVASAFDGTGCRPL